MSTVGAFVVSFLIAYVLGAIPTGFFVGKMWNVDVRKHGSGRTGGTNVLRTVGWGAFIITFIGDILKGAIAVWISRGLFSDNVDAPLFAVLGVLVGHNWSVWIALLAKPDPRIQYAPAPLGWIQRLAQQGRGGAGVAPSAGAAFALFPPIVLVEVVPVVLILVFVRYASVASLTMAFTAPIAMFYFSWNGYAPWSYWLLVLITCIVIILVHIPNIKRLRDGTEKKFGQRIGQKPARTGETKNPPGA